MPKSSERSLVTLTRLVAILFTAVVLAVVAVVTAGVLWTGAWALADRGISAEMLVQGDEQLAAEEATGTLCAENGCVEGWSSEYGNYLRFDSTSAAEGWAARLGTDGECWHDIVLDLRGTDRTDADRQYAVDALTSYES